MKCKISPGWLLIRSKGITFEIWKLLSYSILTQEHWRPDILEKISTFFSPPCSYSLQRVVCFNLGFPFFQIKCFCILSNWAIVLDGTSFNKGRCTTFDIAKVLKIRILPSIVSFSIPHNFNNFSISMIYLL